MARLAKRDEEDEGERPDDAEHPDAYGRLGALMSRLQIYGLKTVLQRRSLIVINPNLPGCCEGAPQPADTITCKPRPDDGGRLWYFTSWQEPIAEADHVVDAALSVATTLGAPTDQSGAGE